MSFASTLSIPKVFQQQKSGWIGVDICDGAIKIAQIQKDDAHWQLLNHKTIPLSLESDQPDILSSAIQTLQQQPALFSLFSGKKAACLLPMSLVELQTMQLPDGTDDELHSMIQQELETLNDSQNDQQEFVFWKDGFCRYLPDGMTGISTASTAQQNVLTIAQQLLKSSCHCEVVDILPFALARAIKMVSSFSADEPVAAFEWGTSTPLFVIMKDGVPVFSRLFRNCGFSNLTQLLRDNMGLDLQESEHMLNIYQSKNSADSSMDGVRQAISDMVAAPLKLLSREFGKTMAFIKQQRSDLLPKQLWLFGAGTALCSVEQVVSEMTGIPSGIWSLPKISGPNDAREAIVQAKLGPAIALSSLAYEL